MVLFTALVDVGMKIMYWVVLVRLDVSDYFSFFGSPLLTVYFLTQSAPLAPFGPVCLLVPLPCYILHVQFARTATDV